MDAARIHIAQESPPFCSACFNPDPGGVHVDFEAVVESPVFAAGYGGDVAGDGQVVASSDQLILCQGCVKAAAALVGFGDIEQLHAQLAEMAERENAMSDRLAAQAAHIDQLEKAATTRERLNEVMTKPGEDDQTAPPKSASSPRRRKKATT